MRTQLDCNTAVEWMRASLEGTLEKNTAEQSALQNHLKTCPDCSADFAARRSVLDALALAYGDLRISDNFDKIASHKLKTIRPVDTAERAVIGHAAETVSEEEGGMLAAIEATQNGWTERLSAAPWWGVSLALHALVILMAGLVSMAFKLPKTDEATVTVTVLADRPKIEVEPPKKLENVKSVLMPANAVPPANATAPEFSNVILPPEMIARAELADYTDISQSETSNESTQMYSMDNSKEVTDAGGGTDGLTLDDAMIGINGLGSLGHGGGWGGGVGDGIGSGNGSGISGAFYIRDPKNHRRSPDVTAATENAVIRALEWLARNQEADGHWDSAKHGGKGTGVTHDAAMTGYALLAFLGAGHCERVGKYKENVKRGVAYLMSTLQDVPGKKDTARWSPNDYTNGIACMALGEAAGMARIKDTLVAAQKAINGVDAAQRQTADTSDREAWDYAPNGGSNDSSIMAWNILALKSCKVGGLKVEHACFEGCLNWINAGQDLGGLKAGDIASYDYEGGMMSYRGTVAVPNKGKGSMSVTAAAGLCRVMIGGAKLDDPGVVGVCNLIKNKHLPKKYPFNLYFAYYASSLMYQKGGEHWNAWKEVLKGPLVEGQARGGDNDGSWEPSADIGSSGRVMSTALGCLCLEVYYRNPRMNRDAK